MVLVLAALGLISPYALLSSIVDGLASAIVMVPPCLLGICLLPLLRLGEMPFRWQVLLGAALGIGFTALLVLILGLAGLLHRELWIGILAVLALLGLIRLRHFSNREPSNPRSPAKASYSWLLLAPFLVLALLAAANAPGVLWREEGYGYDILEYHLALPKEYVQEGRITYAPHNVYANFPANVEMLYLLAMVVHGDVYDIGTTANFIHLFLAVLAVYAAWVMGREWSPAAGLASAVGLGTVGWLAYLCGLAYVENGLLFFGGASLAAVVRAASLSSVAAQRRWLIVAGLLAGLACGCKYTGVAMVAIPIALGLLFLVRGIRQSITAVAVYSLACAITFSPWLVKNAAMTGNPVFPLANSVFQAYPPGWGPVEQERWDRGHSISDKERAWPARLRALWRHTVADHDHRFGPAIVFLALAGLVGRVRQRLDAFLTLVLAVQVVVWLWMTHLYARFAIPMLMPLAALAGRSVGATSRRAAVTMGVLVLGAVWNLSFAIRFQKTEGALGVPASWLYEGRERGFEYLGYINNELPETARLLMVGDARAYYVKRLVDYTVVFNANPFVAIVEQAQDGNAVIDWLRRNEYTHVLVHWAEIDRLRRTYGFSNRITQELFSELSRTGLSLASAFPHPSGGGAYIDLYEVWSASPSQPVPDGP